MAKNLGTAGAKFDAGKPRLDLLDTYAIEQTALVLGFGAEKYASWNWAKGIAYSRLLAAAIRHIFAFMRGEDKDKESGLPHLAHAMCCLMFLLGMSQLHPELDDRFKPETQCPSPKNTSRSTPPPTAPISKIKPRPSRLRPSLTH